jgi:hypothetical protein
VFGNGVLRKRPKGGGGGELQETGKNCMMRGFIICIYHHYIQMITSRGDKMGRACGTLGGEKRNAYRVLIGKPEGK